MNQLIESILSHQVSWPAVALSAVIAGLSLGFILAVATARANDSQDFES